MRAISALTHEFRRGSVDGDGTCLFASFLDVIKPRLIERFGEDLFNKSDTMKNLNEDLRINVTNHIRQHNELHELVLNNDEGYTTVEEYCSAIEQGELWGGDIEINVLSKLYNILICKIDLINIRGGRYLIPSYYGEDNPLASQCVYIYYNGINHFDPLYIINKQNPDEKETIFDPDDVIVNNLMKKFINEELKYEGDIILGTRTASIVANKSIKRKASTFDDLVFSSNNELIPLPISIPRKYYKPNKRVKNTTDATDEIATDIDNDFDITTLIQMEGIQNQPDSPVNQPQTRVFNNEAENTHDQFN